MHDHRAAHRDLPHAVDDVEQADLHARVGLPDHPFGRLARRIGDRAPAHAAVLREPVGHDDAGARQRRAQVGQQRRGRHRRTDGDVAHVVRARGELRAVAIEDDHDAAGHRGEPRDPRRMKLLDHARRKARIARHHERGADAERVVDFAHPVEVEERIELPDTVVRRDIQQQLCGVDDGGHVGVAQRDALGHPGRPAGVDDRRQLRAIRERRRGRAVRPHGERGDLAHRHRPLALRPVAPAFDVGAAEAPELRGEGHELAAMAALEEHDAWRAILEQRRGRRHRRHRVHWHDNGAGLQRRQVGQDEVGGVAEHESDALATLQAVGLQGARHAVGRGGQGLVGESSRRCLQRGVVGEALGRLAHARQHGPRSGLRSHARAADPRRPRT